jgi:fimbrial chaperone protein
MTPVHFTAHASRVLLAVLFIGWPTGLWAGSFQVNPIRLDLSAKSTSEAMTIRNNADEPVVVQVSVEAWSQQDGKDVYAPTKEILVTPPILTIPAGGERVVRAGLRRPPDPGKELSYRLYLQEVPPPPKPGFQGLLVALRVGLPVFVQPVQAPAQVRLVWTARRGAENKLEVHVTNEGTGHVQIAELEVYAPDAKAPAAGQSGLQYVLPGQGKDWSLAFHESARSIDRVRLKAVTDAGNIDTDLELAKP